MMDDVDAGRINCIITKDLSRFGREHVMMDYYLEFVFPEKNIRYIAVTENEDTEKGLSDFVPFKNLFNEWFAKDTSRKVKAALRAKHAAGRVSVLTHLWVTRNILKLKMPLLWTMKLSGSLRKSLNLLIMVPVLQVLHTGSSKKKFLHPVGSTTHDMEHSLTSTEVRRRANNTIGQSVR